MSEKEVLSHLLWIDLEMTGLDVEKERIIEVGAIITDLQFNEVSSYHAVVQQPPELLEQMDEWNQKHHKESGLLDQIPQGLPEPVAEEQLMEWIEQHYPANEKLVLAGNSIWQDRRFIEKYWPRLAKKLHYRMLDVTAWKVLFVHRLGVEHQKTNAHRATDDIRESIGELKTYFNFVRV